MNLKKKERPNRIKNDQDTVILSYNDVTSRVKISQRSQAFIVTLIDLI